jgi:flagellar FlgN protein
MSLSEVSNILWRERRRVELLVFKLEEEQLLRASGRTRWLSDATREIETILHELNRVELERALAVAGVTSALGLDDTLSLRDLAALAPAPWDGILGDHRRALLALVAEVHALTEGESSGTGEHDAAREALEAVGEIDLDAYDALVPRDAGPAVSPDRGSGSECSSRARGRRREVEAVQPSLADFLR